MISLKLEVFTCFLSFFSSIGNATIAFVNKMFFYQNKHDVYLFNKCQLKEAVKNVSLYELNIIESASLKIRIFSLGI